MPTFGTVCDGIGCLTRNDVSYKDQQPRFMVLFDDMSVDSVYVGEKDVFDLERSDADKGREDKKDGFSEECENIFCDANDPAHRTPGAETTKEE